MTNQIYDRITKITGCDGKQAWELMNHLQQEQAPHLSFSEVQDCVILSLVRTYQDYELSWMWFDQTKSYRSESLAA